MRYKGLAVSNNSPQLSSILSSPLLICYLLDIFSTRIDVLRCSHSSHALLADTPCVPQHRKSFEVRFVPSRSPGSTDVDSLCVQLESSAIQPRKSLRFFSSFGFFPLTDSSFPTARCIPQRITVNGFAPVFSSPRPPSPALYLAFSTLDISNVYPSTCRPLHSSIRRHASRWPSPEVLGRRGTLPRPHVASPSPCLFLFSDAGSILIQLGQRALRTRK